MIEEAREMRRSGESIKVIAKMLGKSVGTVHKWVKDIELSEDVLAELRKRPGKATVGKLKAKRPDFIIESNVANKFCEYNPKKIGTNSEINIAAVFLECNYKVYMPLGDYSRSDMIIEDDKDLYRIQCKTGRMLKGGYGFDFQCRSTNWNTGKQNNYKKDVDYIAVYLRENRKVYLFDVKSIPNTACTVRLIKDDSNNRFAVDHELIKHKKLDEY